MREYTSDSFTIDSNIDNDGRFSNGERPPNSPQRQRTAAITTATARGANSMEGVAASSDNVAATPPPRHHRHHHRNSNRHHPGRSRSQSRRPRIPPRSTDYSPAHSSGFSSQNTEEDEEASHTTSGSSRSGSVSRSGSASGSSYEDEDEMSQSTSGEDDDSGSVTSGSSRSGSEDDDSMRSSTTRSSSIESPMTTPRGTMGEETNEIQSTFSTLSPVEGPLSTFTDDDDDDDDDDGFGSDTRVAGEKARKGRAAATTPHNQHGSLEETEQKLQQPHLNLPALDSVASPLSPGTVANNNITTPTSPLLTTNSTLTTLISADSMRPVRVSISETRPSIPVVQEYAAARATSPISHNSSHKSKNTLEAADSTRVTTPLGSTSSAIQQAESPMARTQEGPPPASSSPPEKKNKKKKNANRKAAPLGSSASTVLSPSSSTQRDQQEVDDSTSAAATAATVSPFKGKTIAEVGGGGGGGVVSPTATTFSATTVVTGTANRHQPYHKQEHLQQRLQSHSDEATSIANHGSDLETASSDTTQPTSPGRNSKSRQQPQPNSMLQKVEAKDLLSALAPPQLITRQKDSNNTSSIIHKTAQESPLDNDECQQSQKGAAFEELSSDSKERPAALSPVAAPAGEGTATATTSSSSLRKQPQLHIHTSVVTQKQQPDDLQQTPTLSFPQVSTQGSSPGRSRIPGGAAAKLILVRPQSDDDDDDGDNHEPSKIQAGGEKVGRQCHDSSALGVASGEGEGGKADLTANKSEEIYEKSIKEIEITLKMAKQEFELGSPSNRRYHRTLDEDEAKEDAPNDEMSSYTPSFLNRSEIFFDSASAAIAALLTPRAAAEAASLANKNNTSGNGIVETKSIPKAPSSTTSSAFQTPDETSAFKLDQSYMSFGRRDVSDNLLQPKTERKIEELIKRMHDPTKTLTDLLTAIATPEHRHQMDLGYMVRRKNACGALKVLTNDPKKRLRICWTVGVLPALTSVLGDAAKDGLVASFPDKRIRAEYEAARNRAIATLLNLSIPKPNRIPVFHTPDLVQSLLAVIMDDKGEARKGCTAILAYLSKTVENRLLIVKIPGFFQGLVSVLKPLPSRSEESLSRPMKKHPWSSSDSSEQQSANLSKFKSNDEDSDRTPVVMPSKSSVEVSPYDQNSDELLRASRQNIFAVMNHIGKEKDNTYHITRESSILNTLIDVSAFQDSPSHNFAVKFIANLTRHRLNTKRLVFQERRTVPALVRAANSPSDEARLFACYAIQNMAQDKACRQELAVIDGLISTLCNRGRYAAAGDERLAAISALKNLCDEPANLIPLTNTPACIATLMHLAHGKEEGVTEMMQYRACDALATLSHWLRKIATSGKNLDAMQRGLKPETTLFVPSLRVVTWNQWE